MPEPQIRVCFEGKCEINSACSSYKHDVTSKNPLGKAVLMRDHYIQFYGELKKVIQKYHENSPFSGALVLLDIFLSSVISPSAS